MKQLKKIFMMALVVMALCCMMVMGASAKGNQTTESTAATTLQTALTAGGEVTMTESVTTTSGLTVPADKEVILDLAGFTLSCSTSSTYTITNYGTLTIIDSSDDGTGKITSSSSHCIYNTNNCTINGGSFSGSAIVYNTGTATVATINGGTFSVTYGIWNTNNSTGIINGGVFTVSAPIYNSTSSGGNGLVTAGTFNMNSGYYGNYLEPFISENSNLDNSTSNVYIVSPIPEVSIGDATYATLAAALEKVNSSETITIQVNTELTDDFTIPDGVTVEIAAGIRVTLSATITNNGTLLVNGILYNEGTVSGGNVTNNGTVVNRCSVTSTVTGNSLVASTGADNGSNIRYISNATDLKAFLMDDSSTALYGQLNASFDYDTGIYGVMSITSEKHLNFAGNTVTVPNDVAVLDRPIYLGTGADLEIYGGTFIAGQLDEDNTSQGAYGAIKASVATAVGLDIHDMTFYNARSNALCLQLTALEATISDCVFYSSLGGAIDTSDENITISNCTITQQGTSSNSWASTAVSAAYDNTVTVYGGSFSNSGQAFHVYSSGGTINVYGGDEGTYSAATCVLKTDAADAYINVYSGTFDGVINQYAGKITLYGGTFYNTDLELEAFSAYVADDRFVTANDDGSYIVTQLGDVDGDGDWDNDDIHLILQIATGAITDESYISRTDVNSDGDINSLDAYLLYTYIAS